MTESVGVAGGAGGITANLDDLLAFARLTKRGAASIDEALGQLTAPMLGWLLEVGAEHDRAGARQIEADLAGLVGPSGRLRRIEARLRSLSSLLHDSVELYLRADDGVFSSIAHAFGRLLLGELHFASGNVADGRNDMLSALPGMTDLVMLFGGPLEDGFTDVVPDGHAVLHDMGADTRGAAQVAPHTLVDLMRGLTLRNAGRAGEISVSFVTGVDGSRRAIVDIPGTKSWNPVPNHDITSVGTDIRALDGHKSAYEDGVFAALHAAGVDPSEDVMLVGHSEGGLVAVEAARDAARSGRFHVTHVVTAGSPIGRVAASLPDDVQLLALENSADVVPHVDAATNPDRPDITTVTVDEQHHSVVANHDLVQTYEPAAEAADHSCSPSVDAFVASAHGFLGGSATVTHRYRITRGF